MEPAYNSNPESASDPESGQALAEIIQMCCLGARSGQITFVVGDRHGCLYLQHGQILHGTCEKLEGPEAVFLMLTWPGGSFNFDESILPHKRTITQTWEQLLFESAQRVDQGMSSEKVATNALLQPVNELPVDRTRIQGGQPKVTILSGPIEPRTFELDQEFVHVGRIDGNEIVLPESAVSSRHCMFIRRGEDVLLRDLNSSNGTYVRGQPITEVILHLGDIIQIGGVQLKFEAGVKRPKLYTAEESSQLAALESAAANTTMKLPKRANAAKTQQTMQLNPVALTKQRPIVYTDLAKPEVKKTSSVKMYVIGTLIVLLVIAAGYYFLTLRR